MRSHARPADNPDAGRTKRLHARLETVYFDRQVTTRRVQMLLSDHQMKFDRSTGIPGAFEVVSRSFKWRHSERVTIETSGRFKVPDNERDVMQTGYGERLLHASLTLSQVDFDAAHPRGVLERRQRLVPYLTNALFGEAKLVADLLERHRVVAIDPEIHLENLGLTR